MNFCNSFLFYTHKIYLLIMKIYVLIKGGGTVVGIFSSMKHLKMVVQMYIQENYEKDGYHGWYHFRYAVFDINEPYFPADGENGNFDEARSLFTLSTMHPEYFHHTIENDPNTGEILSWDTYKDTY